MKYLGEFKVVSEEVTTEVDTGNLKVGLNNLKDHILKLNGDREVEYIVSKVCDHAGGKMILKGENAVCPMHGWELNLNTLIYNDSHVCKETVPFSVDEAGIVSFNTFKNHFKNPYNNPSKSEGFKYRWLNHATVYIECNGISLITDPWLLGPAFMTGWWLNEPSTQDSIDLLNAADYVFISHNHPDHLHPETLALMPKDKPIIVGDFKSGSTEKYLNALGYEQVIVLNFNALHELGEDFVISVLKSGDFRDDSGLYLSLNGHEVLLTVDCNYLNAHVLPKNIDLLMTSFAGGASGFPICFDNYTQEEKLQICARNRLAIKSSVLGYVQACTPNHYMPYAGMFKEKADRDTIVRELNQKNSVDDYENWLTRNKAKFIRPSKSVEYYFENGICTEHECSVELLKDEDPSYYIEKYKEDFKYDADKIIKYLSSSGYGGNQIIQIIPTDDAFQEVIRDVVFADFKDKIFKTISPDMVVSEVPGKRVMEIRVRTEIIACIVENMLPWEDFSIGFQLRIKRSPNTYESDFWYYFTNIYINSDHFRYSSYCGACTVINQNPVFNKLNQSKENRSND